MFETRDDLPHVARPKRGLTRTRLRGFVERHGVVHQDERLLVANRLEPHEIAKCLFEDVHPVDVSDRDPIALENRFGGAAREERIARLGEDMRLGVQRPEHASLGIDADRNRRRTQ